MGLKIANNAAFFPIAKTGWLRAFLSASFGGALFNDMGRAAGLRFLKRAGGGLLSLRFTITHVEFLCYPSNMDPCTQIAKMV